MPRLRTLKSARIVIDQQGAVLDCIVRNLSAHGALLLVPSLAVPGRFDLILSTSRAARRARSRGARMIVSESSSSSYRRYCGRR